MVSEPKAGTVVWMSAPYTRTAHSLDGTTYDEWWKTRCGEIVFCKTAHRRYGERIRWGLLNHERVKPCRKCFPAPAIDQEGEG